MEPIIKWAGGKRQLIEQLTELISAEVLKNTNARYYEPFVGGGALAFKLGHPKTTISDINKELINLYKVVRDKHVELIELLKQHKENLSQEYYYLVRGWDRLPSYQDLTDVEKAARLVFLNRTCFNGLYRVNAQGQFNVPFGRQNNPDVVREEQIKQMHDFLAGKDIRIEHSEYTKIVRRARKGDYIYFDPPYDYEDENGFVSYTIDSFTRDDLVKLKKIADSLIEKGCKVVISNNDTTFVNNLFSENKYDIIHVNAHRNINSKGNNRTNAKEVIIYGNI